MKAKKALKRLAKAESLLTGVLDQYPAGANGWRDLVGTARESVSQARAAIGAEQPPARKSAGTAASQKPNRLSEEGRKRISEAAKKRWAAARRKGVSAVTGQKLRRTA